MSDMHISLLATALAGLIAIALGIRCGMVRTREKVFHGDGGSPLMLKRMRAQANFVEYTPFALALIVVLDLMEQQGYALGLSALAFLIGRIAHAIGMDADAGGTTWPRALGMLLTLPILLGWAIWAILLAFRLI